jgi:hypothetical protein
VQRLTIQLSHAVLAFLCFLLCTSHSQASDTSPGGEVLIAAAGRSKGFYLYFQASIDPRSKPNPIASSGQVLIVGKDVPGGILEFSCSGDRDLTKEFQASPYGRGTEGRVVELNCGSEHRFIFLLLSASNQSSTPSCNPTETILGRPALAIAASFGHQAFCMESWEGVSTPKQRLLEAARKGKP